MAGFQAGFCLLGGLSLCHRPLPDASVDLGAANHFVEFGYKALRQAQLAQSQVPGD